MLKFGIKVYLKFGYLLQARNNENDMIFLHNIVLVLNNRTTFTKRMRLISNGQELNFNSPQSSHNNSRVSKVVVCRDATFFQSNSKVRT